MHATFVVSLNELGQELQKENFEYLDNVLQREETIKQGFEELTASAYISMLTCVTLLESFFNLYLQTSLLCISIKLG